MKVLDVSSLHDGIKGMSRQLSELEKQLNHVENGIRAFVSSKDSFTGKGASAIRRFYEYAHLPFLQFFQTFLANFHSKLQQLQYELDGLEGNARGFIDEGFLTSELEDGLNQINRMVTDLTGEVNYQLSRISDIMYLPRLQDHQFHEGIQQAKQSANQTVEKLHQFDHQQTQSFTALIEDLSLLQNYIEEMSQQFASGKMKLTSFSPLMLQDLEAYGKLQTKLYNQTVMQRWNSEHFPELGVFFPIGHAASFDQWVNPSCSRPEPKSAVEAGVDFAGGLWKGFLNAGKDTLEGLRRLVFETDEVILETVDFALTIADDPGLLLEIGQSLIDSYNEQVVHGTAETRGEWFGYAATIIGTSVIGDKGLTKAGKLGKLGGKPGSEIEHNLNIQLESQKVKLKNAISGYSAKAKENVIYYKDKAKNAVSTNVITGMDRVRQLMNGMVSRKDMEPALAGGPVNVLDGSVYMKELQENNKNIITRIEVETGKGKGKWELEDFTKEILRTKPMNSPIPEKWYKKGGVIAIDGDGTWIYTNKTGITVNYPNGFPDFTPFMHPNVQPVKIEVHSPKNNPKDFENANLKANLTKVTDPPIFDIRRPPIGYTWHHHQDGETMVLVVKDIHDEFKHIGGQSKVNGKNSE